MMLRNSIVPTVVLGADTSDTAGGPPSQPTIVQDPRIAARNVYGAGPKAPPPTAHNTTLVVGLTVIATLILIALGGIGAWFLFKGDKPAGTTQTQLNQNQDAQPPGANSNLNNNSLPGANTSPTSTASPTPTPVDVAAVREQVTAVLNGWTSASRAHDLDTHMSLSLIHI